LETASLAGRYDVIARAQAHDTGELARLVTSRVQAPAAWHRRWAARLFTCEEPIAVDHHTTIREVGEGGVQAVCSCGWHSPVFGADKTVGTMDPLQRAPDARDLHEWEMCLR
jgi:hypothetical protein